MKTHSKLLFTLPLIALLGGCASNQEVTTLARETSINLGNLAGQYQRFAETNQVIAEARERGSETLQEVNREAAKVLMLDIELTRKTDGAAIARYDELANWADEVVKLDAEHFDGVGLQEAGHDLASLSRDQVNGLMAVAEKLALLAREEAKGQHEGDSELLAGEIANQSEARMQTALSQLGDARTRLDTAAYLKAATQPELPLGSPPSYAGPMRQGDSNLAAPVYYDEKDPLVGERGWLDYRAGAWEPVRQRYDQTQSSTRHSRGFARR